MDKNTNGGVCMDNKSNNKAINFFKKEGFYVILFVCLCIVATVASITANNNKKLASNSEAIQNEQANAESVLQEQQKQHEGALQVKKENLAKTQVLKPVPNQKVTTGNSAAVSNSVNAQFAKPVVGFLARAYSLNIDPLVYKTDGSYRTNLGIDIQAAIGVSVVSVMDGTVKEIGTDVDGQNGKMVIIDHGNGFVTKYSNLKEITVEVNKKVTKNQKIGTVGDTSLNTFKEDYGSHLHFEVLQSSKNVDPAKYVKYEKYQPAAVKK